MGRGKDNDGTAMVDLSHLGLPFNRKTLVSDAGHAESECADIGDASVDIYDIEKIKKKIIVLFMERMVMFMLSPKISLSDKVTKGMAAMAQWEGTRRIIEWDKRVPDEKDLLAKADKLGKQIVEYSKKQSPEKVATLQIKAAEKLISDLGKDGESSN